MRDDYLSADWAQHRGTFARDVRRLLDTIGAALARLHAIQFDAPWKHAPERR